MADRVTNDLGFWSETGKWLLGVMAAIIAGVWGDNKYQMRKLQSEIKGKTDEAEMNRQRDHIGSIFEQLRQHESDDRSRHEQLVTGMARLEGQMERVVSDIESEKDTRARVNSDVANKLDKLLERKR